MARFTAVTDDDLVRARRDPAFRQQLFTRHLGTLVEELSRRKRTSGEAAVAAGQLREGAEFAVRLADLIGEIDRQAPGAARTSSPIQASRRLESPAPPPRPHQPRTG